MDHKEYRKTDTKPDKLFSILPTVLIAAGDLRGKRVLDIGCGAGFFSVAAAQAGATAVHGIDIEPWMIQEALRELPAGLPVTYEVGDMWNADFPKSDVVLAPFVLGYAGSADLLRGLLTRFQQAKARGGRLVVVLDYPAGRDDLIVFGARKHVISQVDGAQLCIELYNQGKDVGSIDATYYSPETVAVLCGEVGFRATRWVLPVVAQEAPPMDWDNYLKEPELRYLIAYR